MTSTRERLPNRRRADTLDLWYGENLYALTIGEYDDGRPGEVFLHGTRSGSDLDGLHADIAVLMSRLLQYGDDPHALAAGMGRLGVGKAPASVIGAIADMLAYRAILPPSDDREYDKCIMADKSEKHLANQVPAPHPRARVITRDSEEMPVLEDDSPLLPGGDGYTIRPPDKTSKKDTPPKK